MRGLIIFFDVLKRFRTVMEGDVTFSDFIMFNPFNKDDLTEENRMDRQEMTILTSSGEKETTGYIFALIDDMDGMNRGRIVTKVVSLNEKILAAANKDRQYYAMVRLYSPEMDKGGSGDGNGDGNEIPCKKAAVNTRSKGGGGGMKKSENRPNRHDQNFAPGLKSSKGATGGNDGDESDSENEFRQKKIPKKPHAGKRKRKRTKLRQSTSNEDSDSFDSEDADSDDADSDAHGKHPRHPRHLAKKRHRENVERSPSSSKEVGGRDEKNSGNESEPGDINKNKNIFKRKQAPESSAVALAPETHDNIGEDGRLKPTFGSKTAPKSKQISSGTTPQIHDQIGGGGGTKPRTVSGAGSRETTPAPRNQDNNGGANSAQTHPARSNQAGTQMLGQEDEDGLNQWDDNALVEDGENQEELEAEEGDYLTEMESKKKSYRKELARLPREFLDRRKALRDEHPTLAGIFDYLDLILRENNRRLNLLSSKVDALQVASADIEAAFRRVDMKLEKSDVKTPAGARSIRRISGIPWKNVGDVKNALCALKGPIVEMIMDRYPKKKTYWITPILKDLFQPYFAKRVRFSASKNERRSRNYVRMGVHCPVLPVSFTDLVRELISKNTILDDAEQEFKCAKNYFNNRNRAMRKTEIKRHLDTALDQQQGLKSKTACLLIANDLCESAGCITQPCPDTRSEREMAAWLESFWKPALTKIATKKLHLSPEAVINDTHLNIINMCLKVKSVKNKKSKREITIDDLRNYADVEDDDCYNNDNSEEEDDDGGDEGMTHKMIS